MKGKIGLVVGLGAGYVLGTRAGRERYEQIKKQWLKVWNLDPVQDQVDKVKTFARSQAAAVPGAVWNGAVKVVQSVSGSGTPGHKLDSVIATGKDAVEDVARAADDTATEAKKPSAGKPAAKNSTTGSGSAKSGS
ncbi:hypothetical protein [Microbacterium aurantiacum]|uniref:hypothetical protein n=1 Tax=Microbacterium aurantiacum TaxID=162393 RepID=UPI000C810132|nr:hypothetical protein [Microbacterium aurantiacum]